MGDKLPKWLISFGKIWFGTKYERTASLIVLLGLSVFVLSTSDLLFNIFARLGVPIQTEPVVAVLGFLTTIAGAGTLMVGKYFDKFPSQTYQRDCEKVQIFNDTMPFNSYENLLNSFSMRSLNEEERDLLFVLERFFENSINEAAEINLKTAFSDFRAGLEALVKFHRDYFFRPDISTGIHPISRFKFPMRDGRNLNYDEYILLDNELDGKIKRFERSYLSLVKVAKNLGHL